MDIDWLRYFVIFMVIILIAFVGIVFLIYKKRQYDNEAEQCIKGVLRLPTGHDISYIKECKDDAEWIEMAGGSYRLNPKNKRWSKYPSRPLLGLKMMQTNIRTEYWDLDNPNPVIAPDGSDEIYLMSADGKTRELDAQGNFILKFPTSTAQQIYAYANNVHASSLIAEQQELEENQDMIVKTLRNQASKWALYTLLAILIIVGIANLVINAQLGGIV